MKNKFNKSIHQNLSRATKSTVLFLCIALFNHILLLAQNKKVSKNNIEFISFPDFPDAHSSWGSIGYNPKYKTVHISVTNHRDNIALYDYNVVEGTIQQDGFIKDLANLRTFQWQGKIHSKIVSAPDGTAFMSSDGGESREEYLMNNPYGYAGGFFMSWNPGTKTFKNLGMGLQYESIKDIEIDPQSGLIYGITYPQAHFLVYDPSKNDLRDLGRLASSHVPRVLFTDSWGNCYYVDWRQRLVKYEKSKDKLIFAEESLPAFPGTPGNKIITGITAYAKDIEKGIIYLVTYGAKVLAFHPQQNGIGKVEDLGGVIDSGGKDEWRPYVPNLNLGANGKLYYIIGGHGNYVKENTTVLVQFDPKTGKKNIIYEFPITALVEATGSNIRDYEGNLYFTGRKQYDTEIKDNNTAFLIKFNPEKPVTK